jgi:hypothetical protein
MITKEEDTAIRDAYLNDTLLVSSSIWGIERDGKLFK